MTLPVLVTHQNEMEEDSSFEDGNLVIDVTSDEEEPTNDKEKNADDKNENGGKLCVNSEFKTLLTTSQPVISPGETASDKENNSSMMINHELVGVLDNYTPSELIKLTTASLIKCIQSLPALWDSTDINYNNNFHCTILWQNISVVLNTPVQSVKKKWYRLRSCYRREYFKSKQTGIPSRYSYYDILNFLEDEIKKMKQNPRNANDGNDGPSCDNSDDDDCMIIEDDDEEFSNVRTSETTLVPGDGNGVQSINGTATEEPARPKLVIRPIAELMAVGPANAQPNVETRETEQSNSPDRAESPDISLLETPVTISDKQEIIVTNSFPKPSSASTLFDAFKSKLRREMDETIRRAISKSPPRKKSKKRHLSKHRRRSEIGEFVAGETKRKYDEPGRSSGKSSQKSSETVRSSGKAEQKFSDPLRISGKAERKFSDPVRSSGMAERKSSEPVRSSGMAERKSSEPVRSSGMAERKSSEPVRSSGMAERKSSEPVRSSGMAEGTSSETVRSSEEAERKSSEPVKNGKESPLRQEETLVETEVHRGFLLSLLPDVEGMNDSQFRTFKKQACSLVEMVLGESN